MSKPNTPVQSAPKVITRSQPGQDSQLANIVDQKQKSFLKIKGSIKNRENLSDNMYQNIRKLFPTEQELDDTLQLDDSSLDKTLINTQCTK